MWFIGQLGKHLGCLQEYPHSSVLEFFLKKNLYTSTLMIVAVYIFSLFLKDQHTNVNMKVVNIC